MWLCTTDGFYSVIQWYDGRICVRAREKVALDRLRKTHLPTLSKEPISPYKDYRYRGFCTRDELEAAMVSISKSIDYGNFKDAVKRKQGASRYEQILHSAWSLFGRLQPAGPYSMRASSSSPEYPPVPKGEQAKQLAAARERPTTSLNLRSPEVECEDCGRRGSSSSMVKLGDRWLCSEVGPCLDRTAAKT